MHRQLTDHSTGAQAPPSRTRRRALGPEPTAADRRLAESEERLRLIFANSPLPMWVYDLETLRFLEVNAAAEAQYGWTRDEFLASQITLIRPPGDVARLMAHLNVTRGVVESLSGWTHRRRDGSLFEAEISSHPLSYDGREAVIVVAQDLTERRAAEANQARLAAIVEAADDPIIGLDLDGTVTAWNHGAERSFGRPATDAIGQPLVAFLDDGAALRLEAVLSTVASGRSSDRIEASLTIDGRRVDLWISLSPVRDRDGTVVGVSVVGRDMTEQRRLERELTRRALHDSLTGLPNRVLLIERLGHAMRRRALRTGERSAAVLFIDLDDFKVVNDSMGHPAGDALLIEVANRLRGAMRDGDTAARLGGDEFTVLLEDLGDPAEADLVAERLIKAIGRPIQLAGREVVIGASIGVTAAGPDQTPDDVLRDADIALYEAKGRGKARVERYDRSMAERAWRRLELESDLRRDIEAGRLVVHYQPIVDLKTERIIEFEALVRWAHPEHGTLVPDDFIPLAEATGLIVPLGRHVLATACAQLSAWQQIHPGDPGLVMSVNISPRQFRQHDLVEMVAATLAEHSIDPHCLKLEITENAIIGDEEGALVALQQLKALGVHIAIDDFGSGYASFGYFRQYPIDSVKIDRSFISRLGIERESTAIVDAAVQLARALGMVVTGEGIETESQAEALRGLDCELGQGYLYARPMPAEAVTDLLTDLLAVRAAGA